MAVANLKNWERFFYPTLPHVREGGWAFSTSQLEINASGEIVAVNFQAPVAGNLNAVRVWNTTGGSAGSTMDVEVYAVDNNGYATGAALASTTGVAVDGSSAGSTLVNFTPFAVTRGQKLVLHCEWASGAIRLLGNIESNRHQGNATRHFTGSWAAESYLLVWEMDIGGTVYTAGEGQVAIQSGNLIARDTADTSPYIGLKFQLPFNCKISGLNGYWGGTNQSADNRSQGRWILVDSSNVVLTQTPTLGRWDFGALNQGPHTSLFEDEVSLTKNTTYRLYLEPFGAIYGMQIETLSRAAAADLHSMIDTPWDFTESTDESTWVDDDTLTPVINLMVSEIASDGAGACDYPGIGDVRNGVSYDNGNLTGNLQLPTESQVLNAVGFGSLGTEFTGNVVLPVVGDVQDGVNFGALSALTGTLELPLASQVLNGVGFGAGGIEFSGNYVTTATGDVRASVNFGSLSSETGTLVLPIESQVLNGIGFGASGTEFIGNVFLPGVGDVRLAVTFGSNNTLIGTLAVGGGGTDTNATVFKAT